MRRQMQHEARRDDDAVAAPFCTGQAAQELVGDVLAQTDFAEGAAGNLEDARSAVGGGRPRRSAGREARHLAVVDLAEVVADARDLRHPPVGVHHAPGHQIVQRRAPQHRLLAARVGDVAADAGGIGGGRIDREDQAGASAVHHAARDHARATRWSARCPPRRQRGVLDRAEAVQLSVLITADSGVSGTAAPGGCRCRRRAE